MGVLEAQERPGLGQQFLGSERPQQVRIRTGLEGQEPGAGAGILGDEQDGHERLIQAGPQAAAESQQVGRLAAALQDDQVIGAEVLGVRRADKVAVDLVGDRDKLGTEFG